MTVMPTAVLAEVARQLAAFLAVLLAAAAVHKALVPRASVAAVSTLVRVPRALAGPAVVLAATLELLAAVGLLTGAGRAAGALLAMLLFALYLALLGGALRRGERGIDCGCHFGGPGRGLGFRELARNAVLVVLAGLVAAGARAAPTGVLAARHLLIGAACFALYLAVESLVALPPVRRTA